jgi:hypothetical protein
MYQHKCDNTEKMRLVLSQRDLGGRKTEFLRGQSKSDGVSEASLLTVTLIINTFTVKAVKKSSSPTQRSVYIM